MSVLAFSKAFRLSPSGVACDDQGLRVGGVPLLARDLKGAWTALEESELQRGLSLVYGFPVQVASKRAGFAAVARALQAGDLAKAQIAALLLRLPDPPPHGVSSLAKADRRPLAEDLVACGLLKADDDWDEQHPRTGTPPNPGWFATKPKPPEAPPRAEDGAPSGAGASGPDIAVPPVSLLAEDLPATALEGLTRLAARFNAPEILFDAIFVPSANPLVEEGPVPGRSNMTYRWAHDETEVTFHVLIDGEWKTLTAGKQEGNLFYDSNGETIARIVAGQGQRPTLVTTLDVLDKAAEELERQNSEPAADTKSDEEAPKLCPDPTPEPKTTQSESSIRYQEYVTGLPYGLAINVGGVDFDGCDPETGDLLEAKANIDFMFDGNDKLYGWVDPQKVPAIQMGRQSRAAVAAGRLVVWHAQTWEGYQGLSGLLQRYNFPDLSVVYDPN